ncbi:glucose-6-phosphate dehydrogenase [Microbacterium foliorum]|uniref:glucose-6-phosphate dehydrogenase n=1 Tax=Microbacterium foliorum TaxID=104336 RepID=UPI001DEA1BA9|nr:glucose-6-phosphate dehydrogenase [Microbacterium foliorum]CAH0149932.1 Glucose-6-phosphate 1-dehydrogenase [Microbacterium foliorum]CAH0151491.1 Glucose-6-phosphate 1-dehydrogenase [Microbacterium foliorum]
MTAATTLVIFGAGGDLASRLLLPALGQLLTREPSRAVRIVGADREDWTDADLEAVVTKAFASMDAEEAASRVDVTFVRADITDAEDLRTLLQGCTGQVALYFAVPPSVAEAAIEALTPEMLPAGTMLVMEKPFGTDEASARALNRTLTALVPEHQIYRVDHFLGRSTTLNLLGARFANRILEPLWSAESIESVDIVYDEVLALEGRSGYYDAAGALVDMIQSHLLQVLAVLAMEEPATLDEVDFRAATSAVLRATAVWADDPATSSRRARYTAGSVGGAEKPSYVDEPGVDADRRTETLAEATFEVRNARWAGTPFRLRSGKALGTPATEIVVRFRPVRHLPTGLTGSSDGAVLRFSLGPDRISLELNLNAADDPFELERAALSADLGEGALKAYAEVLSGVLDGDPLLSVRGDAAEECWRIVAPILDAWRRDEVPLDEYPAGSSGPAGWPTHA